MAAVDVIVRSVKPIMAAVDKKMQVLRRHEDRTRPLLVFATCVVCYLNSVRCGFVFDDMSAVRANKDLLPTTPISNLLWNDFWGTPMHKEQSHKSYRPLCVLTFRWNYAIHQLEPMGYHVVNVVLHGVVTVMFMRMCNRFLTRATSFFAAMLFAVHPIHTEAVSGVVGRAETLSAIFFLASFVTYAKCTQRRLRQGWRQLLLTGFLAMAAMLCKEQGITVIGVCCIYEVFVVQKLRLQDVLHPYKSLLSAKGGALSPGMRDALLRMVFLLGVAGGLLMARMRVMGAQLPVFTRFDNPASVAPTPSRQLTYNYLLALNAWLMLFPCNLCCDWTMGTIPLIESLWDARNLTTLAFYSGILLLAWISLTAEPQRARLAVISLALLVLPFLPASNLFFPVGFVIAERILYTPSMGFCMLVAQGLNLINRKRCFQKLVWTSVAILLLAHTTKTVLRNKDWESEYTIFMAGLRVNQRNAKLFNNVGHALESQERFEEALTYFHKAVSVQPDDIGAHINVGRTHYNLKMFKEAEEAYVKAKNLLPRPRPGEHYQARIAPNHLNVFVSLANVISRNVTRLAEADALYRQAISMRADYTQAYINRGDVLIKMNRTREAQEVYEKALQFDSSNPDIYYNLGVVFLELGKATQALAYLDKALQFDPDHQQALMNSAILIQESGNPDLRQIAYDRLHKLMIKDESNERIYFNLGMLAMDDKDFDNAEKWFKTAIQLKKDFRSAMFNLALLLSDAQRPLEAAPFLQQLLKYHPDHVKGLILLGDIYINHIKDLDAAQKCYERILELDHNNVQGLHNLCVVHVERGELRKAEQCLLKAQQMAPNEDYITRHLKIVQARMHRQNQVLENKKKMQEPLHKVVKPTF